MLSKRPESPFQKMHFTKAEEIEKAEIDHLIEERVDSKSDIQNDMTSLNEQNLIQNRDKSDESSSSDNSSDVDGECEILELTTDDDKIELIAKSSLIKSDQEDNNDDKKELNEKSPLTKNDQEGNNEVKNNDDNDHQSDSSSQSDQNDDENDHQSDSSDQKDDEHEDEDDEHESEDDEVENEEVMITDSDYFHTSQRTTYGSLLAQGHLYFRSWNELQAQIIPNPKQNHYHYHVPPVMEKVPTEFHSSSIQIPLPSTHLPPLPPPPAPPPKPPRQRFESDVPELSQDLKSESHDGWEFEEDEFIAITLLNAPFIDENFLIGPQVS